MLLGSSSFEAMIDPGADFQKFAEIMIHSRFKCTFGHFAKVIVIEPK